MSDATPVEATIAPSSLSALERQMDEDQEWALANYSDLVQRYPGEYLLVWKKQVVAHDKDPEQLVRQARMQGNPPSELVLVAFPGLLDQIH